MPTAGEQGGDRQRREKGPPILTAEKGEHERAPPLCDSYPAPLRATLRAPPSKWAIGAFFPESPCRVLSLVLSFASKESTAPSGRQPHRPRRSRRVKPQQREVYAHGRTKGLSSGQTIGAVRTAVRSACCLPELRVANRLRRLYPPDTRFPSFPFGNLRAPKAGEIFPIGLQAPLPAPTAARQTPPAEGLHLRARQRAFLGANNRRGSHCRALRLLFA